MTCVNHAKVLGCAFALLVTISSAWADSRADIEHRVDSLLKEMTLDKADVVVPGVGERWDMSGEAKSRSALGLPGVQEELIKAIVATGKPVVVMSNAGRPLVFAWVADHAPAILYTWWFNGMPSRASLT